MLSYTCNIALMFRVKYSNIVIVTQSSCSVIKELKPVSCQYQEEAAEAATSCLMEISNHCIINTLEMPWINTLEMAWFPIQTTPSAVTQGQPANVSVGRIHSQDNSVCPRLSCSAVFTGCAPFISPIRQRLPINLHLSARRCPKAAFVLLSQ